MPGSNVAPAVAERLKSELRRNAIEVWLDADRVDPGARLEPTIERAIFDANYVIVLVTSNSLTSNWVQLETKFALNAAQEAGRAEKVIPLRHGDCALPTILENRAYVELAPNWDLALGSLLKVLRKDTVPLASNRKLVVDASGSSRFSSINEALEHAQAGDKIIIREGVYREALFITKAVELIGDPLDAGQRVIVSFHEPNFVQMHSSHASLRNICFAFEPREEPTPEDQTRTRSRASGEGILLSDLTRAVEARPRFREEPPYAAGPVQIPVLEVLGEEIRAPRGPILYGSMSSDGRPPVMGRIVEPTKQDVHYGDCQIGVYVRGVILFAVGFDLQRHDAAGELLIENCDIDCAGGCQGVVTSGNVILRGTTIRRPEDVGAVLHGMGSLLVEDCSFDADSKGIECKGMGRVLIKNSRFTGSSVALQRYARARITSSVFEESKVYVSSHAHLEMKRCKVRKESIALSGDSYLSLEDSSVSESETWGVYVSTGSFAHVSDCEIFNNEYGIYISENGQGNVIERCRVYGNSREGVVLRKKSRSTLIGCSIFSNRSHGVLCEMEAFGEIRESKIYDNRASGAAVCSGAELEIIDSDLCRNEDFGVQTESESRARVLGCNVLQNGEKPFERGGVIRVTDSETRG